MRDCSTNTNREPLVLAVYHEKKVYNIKIRFVESSGKFALGTGQRSNEVRGPMFQKDASTIIFSESSHVISPQMFDSVADIIKIHTIFPIILISGRSMPGSKCPENCVLTCPITKKEVVQLLQ